MSYLCVLIKNKERKILENEIPEIIQFLTKIYSKENIEKLNIVRKFFNKIYHIFSKITSYESYNNIILKLISTKVFVDLYNSPIMQKN